MNSYSKKFKYLRNLNLLCIFSRCLVIITSITIQSYTFAFFRRLGVQLQRTHHELQPFKTVLCMSAKCANHGPHPRGSRGWTEKEKAKQKE